MQYSRQNHACKLIANAEQLLNESSNIKPFKY